MSTKLRTVGLLGGMTYDATALYYRTINDHVRSVLGGSTSAPILIHSFDFGPLLPLFLKGEWDSVTELFVEAADGLIKAGAQAIVICANFPHMVADRVQERLGDIPILHIADFTGAAIKKTGKQRVGLLGAKPVMEEAYIKERIRRKYGIEVLVPEAQNDRDDVHHTMMESLPSGNITSEVKMLLRRHAQNLISRGAEGLILGSTDLGFAIKPGDVSVPLFDTNQIHAQGIAEWILREHGDP